MTAAAGRRTSRPDAASPRIAFVSNTLDDQIDAIESGYEFLLAYAAQGRDSDASPSGKSEVRDTLARMSEAADGIVAALADAEHEFAGIVADDARKSLAAMSLVSAQPAISSELVDNLNASIHLRALLTDLFLLSETRHSM